MREVEPQCGHIKIGSDGHARRLHRCDCGTALYSKDLTDNTISFETKDRGIRNYIAVAAGVYQAIACPNPRCKKMHQLVSIHQSNGVDSLRKRVVQ